MKVKQLISRNINKFLRNSDMSINTDFLLELNDEGILLLKGGTDIKVYKDDRIMINCNEKCIYIKGVNLYISSFDSNCTEIDGQIISIEFMN